MPPVYRTPSKYVDVKDPSRLALLIDMNGVLMHCHKHGGSEDIPNLDVGDHEQIE